jgi:hypothetical protein
MLPPENVTAEELEEEYRLLGVFKGFVDEIGLRLGKRITQEWYAFSFRKASDTAVFEELPQDAPVVDVCLVEVELPNFVCVSERPETIEAFFAGRPVTADYHIRLSGIRLTRLASETGKDHAAKKAALEAILGKLNDEEIQTLVDHGLTRYTY